MTNRENRDCGAYKQTESRLVLHAIHPKSLAPETD